MLSHGQLRFSSASMFLALPLFLCNQRSITKSSKEMSVSPIIRISLLLWLACLFWFISQRLSLCQVLGLFICPSQATNITETVSRERPGEKFVQDWTTLFRKKEKLGHDCVVRFNQNRQNQMLEIPKPLFFVWTSMNVNGGEDHVFPRFPSTNS